MKLFCPPEGVRGTLSPTLCMGDNIFPLWADVAMWLKMRMLPQACSVPPPSSRNPPIENIKEDRSINNLTIACSGFASLISTSHRLGIGRWGSGVETEAPGGDPTPSAIQEKWRDPEVNKQNVGLPKGPGMPTPPEGHFFPMEPTLKNDVFSEPLALINLTLLVFLTCPCMRKNKFGNYLICFARNSSKLI